MSIYILLICFIVVIFAVPIDSECGDYKETEKIIRERIQQEENPEHIVNIHIFYMDDHKALYFRAKPSSSERYFYVEEYNLRNTQIHRIIPYPHIPWTHIFFPGDQNPETQFAFYIIEKNIALIGLDLTESTWFEYCYIPEKVFPNLVVKIPLKSELIFSYEHEDFRHNNEMFSMATLDIETCEFKNILQDVVCQNHLFSSADNRLVFLVLNHETLLYVDTANPWYFPEVNGIPQVVDLDNAYNRLWLMSIPSNSSILLATDEQRFQDNLKIEENVVIWNGKEIGTTEEILQNLMSEIEYSELY